MIDDRAARAWAILFARAVVGLIFFMAGVWKVFQLGPIGHVQRYFLPFQHTFLPTWSLWAVGFAIPFVELIAGGLVIVGFQTRPALLSLGIILVIVTFGHLLDKPLYALHEHVIPRLALVLLVLLLPREWDRFAIDAIFRRSTPSDRSSPN